MDPLEIRLFMFTFGLISIKQSEIWIDWLNRSPSVLPNKSLICAYLISLTVSVLCFVQYIEHICMGTVDSLQYSVCCVSLWYILICCCLQLTNTSHFIKQFMSSPFGKLDCTLFLKQVDLILILSVKLLCQDFLGEKWGDQAMEILQMFFITSRKSKCMATIVP